MQSVGSVKKTFTRSPCRCIYITGDNAVGFSKKIISKGYFSPLIGIAL
jgi:hypothetical protein